jgi:hypothetical protein
MPQQPLEAGFRFIVACGVLLAFAHYFGRDLLELILPLFRWELGVLDDRYRILHFGLAAQGADGSIRLDVALQRPVVVGGHLVLPDPRGHASVTTLAGHVLQPVIVFLALLVAWPARARGEALIRAACGLALLPVLLLIDLPFVLTGELWALFVDRYAPGSFSPLLAWKDFLQGGGRLALAFAAGGMVIGASRFPPRPFRRLGTTEGIVPP